jgi:hypothetical protein
MKAALFAVGCMACLVVPYTKIINFISFILHVNSTISPSGMAPATAFHTALYFA